MALSCNLQVLELSGLRLDQPLTGCGSLNASEAGLASEARFVAVQRAFQAALDRRVDLVVLHSDVLSKSSAGGRAPWFLAKMIESCSQRGIPVVWAEAKHNVWMERFVASPAWLVRAVPGDAHRVTTKAGAVLVHVGRPTSLRLPAGHDEVQAVIGLDCGTSSRLDLDGCDLVLQRGGGSSDRIEDFVTATHAGEPHPLAALHTLRVDRANRCETLDTLPVGFTRVSCSLSSGLSANSLVEHFGDEIDAAAGRYFAAHPQTQLLLVDLSVTGHGAAWDSLWNRDDRQSLIDGLNERTRHPSCHVRSLEGLADGVEATRSCPFTPTLNAIWTESTARPVHAVRSLADLVPDSMALGDWSRHQPIPVDHSLAPEVRHACLHLLRSAS